MCSCTCSCSGRWAVTWNATPESAGPVVVARGLTRRFGDFVAVDHVSFEVYPGEVVGYLGPNGSGKTTTIRMLLGLLRPSEGEAWVLGHSVRTESEAIRQKVGYMSQRFALYDELTVYENLAFYAGVYGVRESSRLQEVCRWLGLHSLRDTQARALPVGWRQRLALAVAIIHQPQVLFLDEPTSGVDPSARRAFWDLIYDLTAQGMTAFVTTHYMDEAEYCHRVGIMRQGRLLAMDTPGALKEQALPGHAWDVFAHPLLAALATLEKVPGVLRVGLAGDHLRVVSRSEVSGGALRRALRQAGQRVERVLEVEPSLEDVFLALAG
ncbi:MAG TPA: ABC transporter ATP-binding protein [Anaerolineae bacterium]|nr:ABC transporter ATP-binding protein [Anaerolineae bacterium]HID83531.1 ABC transporter ATP-binding protein [Anaerolineales bacterium]HIQ08077.1 ABC transporter ATP-binding protein [Anaerolineaceae bacterium]